MNYTEFLAFKSIFYFCSLPLRLDSYSGCFHGCLYCFSQYLNNRNNNFFDQVIAAEPFSLERYLDTLDSYSGPDSPVRSCLKRRIPIHFGNVSDPFQPIETKKRISLNFLKTLLKYNYPTVISTKSALIASPDYLPLIKDLPSSVQISFSTFNEQLSRKIEPFSPSPTNRMRTLQKLSEAGIHTTARIQPFLYPLETVSDIYIRDLAASGIRHLTFEHLRIPTNSRDASRNRLWSTLGMDMLQEYKKFGHQVSRINYEIASSVKIENILAVREIAHNYGLTFGAADNEFHHISDDLCCCGLPPIPEFSNYYDGHLGRGPFEGIRTGTISFNYLEEAWQPDGSVIEYVNSECRFDNSNSVLDFLKHKVNTPGSSNSPESFYGIESDKNGSYRVSPKHTFKLHEGYHDQ